MPPRKRTNQSKRTPSASPTASTSHASADHHHQLRHTGRSISIHAGVGATPSKPPPPQPKHSPEPPSTQEGPPETKQPTAPPAPSRRSSFSKLTSILLSLALLLLVWYVYGMVTLLGELKDEVGWWGVIVGDSGGVAGWETLKGWGFGLDRAGWHREAERFKTGDLEGSLNALADALGISPVQVASAVRPLIPDARLSSIAAKETGGSEAVRILYEDTTKGDKGGTLSAEGSAEKVGAGKEFARSDMD